MLRSRFTFFSGYIHFYCTCLPFPNLIPARSLLLLPWFFSFHSIPPTSSSPLFSVCLSPLSFLAPLSWLCFSLAISTHNPFFFPSFCRNLVESVLLWTAEDGDHQPRPADHDQRGHHPPLGLGARAQRGLEAPWCRVDHRLQEHVRLSQVVHPSSTFCFIRHGFYFGTGYKGLTFPTAPNAEVLRLNRGRQLADCFGLRSGWVTGELLDVPAAFRFYSDPTCAWRQVLHSWDRTSENLRRGRCRVSVRGSLASDCNRKESVHVL